jgi:CRISPR-associated protein Cst1
MTKNSITLYPSNWLYNAGVVGLLKILKEEDLKKVEFDSGNVRIPKDWFIPKDEFPIPYVGKLLTDKIVSEKDLNDWLQNKDKGGKTNEEKYKDFVNKHFSNFYKEGYKYVRAGGKWFFGSKTPFQNLVQQKEWLEFQLFKLIKNFVEQDNNGQLVCTFCKRKNIPFEFLKKEKSLEKRLIIFADPHTDELGASIGKFPNSFWNNKSSIFICPYCVYLFIHHRLAFIPTSEGEIFINASDFKLIWDLNRFAENLLQKSKEYEIRKILGSSLLQWAIKRRTLLGAWTMMNIEVIIKSWHKEEKKWIIDYFDLPQNITKILLDYEIASLIEEINEEKIFDLILQGKFSELEKANYFVLRTILKLKNKEKNKEKISKNDPITKYFTKYQDFNYLKKVSEILPELYIKILEKIGR